MMEDVKNMVRNNTNRIFDVASFYRAFHVVE